MQHFVVDCRAQLKNNNLLKTSYYNTYVVTKPRDSTLSNKRFLTYRRNSRKPTLHLPAEDRDWPPLLRGAPGSLALDRGFGGSQGRDALGGSSITASSLPYQTTMKKDARQEPPQPPTTPIQKKLTKEEIKIPLVFFSRTCKV